MTTQTSIAASLILVTSGLFGCASAPPPGERPSYPTIVGAVSGDETAIGSSEGVARLGVADVQVFRDGPILTMTNTGPETLGPGLLWINAAYSIEIDAIPTGERVTIDLRECLNEFGQPFRGGGFFATERPDEVVLAEIETNEGMMGLKVTTRPGV